MVVKKEDKLQDVQELQVIAQLIDNMVIITDKLEKAYDDKDSVNFKQSKEEILKSQKQIENMRNYALILHNCVHSHLS